MTSVERLLERLEKVARVDMYIDNMRVVEEDDPGGRYVRVADLNEAIGPFVLAGSLPSATTQNEPIPIRVNGALNDRE